MADLKIEAPVRGHYDVIVCGGGTAGCTAAIAAARGGAKTLMIERSGSPGGMLTTGNCGLTKYLAHNSDTGEYKKIVGALNSAPDEVQVVGGITMEITERLLREGAGVGTSGTAGSYVFTSRPRFKWLLCDMLEEEGVELLFFSSIADVIVEDGKLKGVVVFDKAGYGVYTAGCFVDATGDGDVAAKAGAPFVYGVGESDLAVKMGVPIGSTHHLGVMYRVAGVNTEELLAYLSDNPERFIVQHFGLMELCEVIDSHEKGEMFVFDMYTTGKNRVQIYNTPDPGVMILGVPCVDGDGLSAEDMTRVELEMGKKVRTDFGELKKVPGFEDSFIIDCPDVCVRETRHIRGEYVIGIMDVINAAPFEDSVGRGCHPVDIHPAPPEIKQHKFTGKWSFQIPYRSLVPKGVDALLTAGRCISADREASGSIRPTVQCMITGEAAGAAAALCVKDAAEPRGLEYEKLREVLLARGAVL